MVLIVIDARYKHVDNYVSFIKNSCIFENYVWRIPYVSHF